MTNTYKSIRKLDSFESEYQELSIILEQANQIASVNSLDTLVNKMLDLMITVCGAQDGILYLFENDSENLNQQLLIGESGSSKINYKKLKMGKGSVWKAISIGSPILIEDLETNQDLREIDLKDLANLFNILLVPLIYSGNAIGLIQISNFRLPNIEVMPLLANRIASELDKIISIGEGLHQRDRLRSLVDILTRIGNTLDREQLLTQIVESGRKLLNSEACSLFLSEEPGGDQFLYFASPPQPKITPNVSIPAKKGIIGAVVSSGKSLLVNEVKSDPQFYPDIDNLTKFDTRTVIAVPIWETTLKIGQRQIKSKRQVIGVLEALNSSRGTFINDDVEILEMLAAEATTVLQLSDLYSNATEIFMDLINALSSAIDAKDPYTEGHSRRVSVFSVAIGKSLGLQPQELDHLQVGSLLHDLGKIGVPDDVLQKPGRLSKDEYEKVKQHTLIGEKILNNVRLLKEEIPALVEHHERLDGSGYPRGLKGKNISSMGKIVAVADVFDAMTSDRTYRKRKEVAEVLDYLRQNANVLFDSEVVMALVSEYQKGEISLEI